MNAQTIVQKAPGAAVATDEHGCIESWNERARALFGYGKDRKVLGKPLLEFLDVRDVFGNRVKKESLGFWDMATRGEPVQTVELRVCRADGEQIKVSVTVIVVLGPQEGDSRVVYLLRKVFRRRRADEAIERILSSREYVTRDVISLRNGVDGDPKVRLTPRQLEVLRFMARGANSQEIAQSLGVSINTVRTHVQRLLSRLQVHSQLEAVAKAYQNRLL